LIETYAFKTYIKRKKSNSYAGAETHGINSPILALSLALPLKCKAPRSRTDFVGDTNGWATYLKARALRQKTQGLQNSERYIVVMQVRNEFFKAHTRMTI